MDRKRIYVNFDDRDPAGRVRIHAVFQPLAGLPEADMAHGEPVVLDDERGQTAPGTLVFDDWTGDWLAEAAESFKA